MRAKYIYPKPRKVFVKWDENGPRTVKRATEKEFDYNLVYEMDLSDYEAYCRPGLPGKSTTAPVAANTVKTL